MPGTQLRNAALLKPDYDHYIRRIQAAQVHTAYSPPEILHWDSTRTNLRAWSWPSNYETGERIAPSELEDHRRTHHFMAPCCLCAISTDEGYVESKIGLVLVAPGANKPEVNGEYVAQCALNRCGYFIPLERFYARKVLQVKAYPKRVLPLLPQQLNYISDVDPESEANGLSQALPFSGIWNRGSRNLLKVEEPVTLNNACVQFTALWARGVDEETFWQMFVQCCRIEREALVWPMDEDGGQTGNGDTESLSGDTEIIDWDDTDTDDEMPPLEPLE
ncbi:hypothetical protein BKA70DRAFT_1449073 [Coprinopsis sp. MPI-PUGE-AT-0042]|nr:hypothetical protein BKA70DRAFT_1450425 [Coprinopsis sp. MPI-PUGE-AT-0042]KAH6872116.1 hypothetical protein BKA70DRAFT_1450437 [Coprinopsis sp. MPI-PUGE-AT-0042]KAH6876313.1 hypothetical protein BKA70DRAFT_1449073 [Coprinopsis sp. MPI-PUGE-AT-0042]